jgi:cytochrome d ubiquinol oxidase subunit II
VIVAVVAGGAILFPSLGLLFKLTLSGRLDHGVHKERPGGWTSIPIQISPVKEVLPASRTGPLVRLAAACLISGVGFLTFADAGWAHVIGVVSLLAFILIGFVAAAPTEVAQQSPTGG